MRGRSWGPDDRTGGPLDRILSALREAVPGLVVERLDDDEFYVIGDDAGLDRVQIACGQGGTAPFVIENGGSIETSDVAEAVALVRTWLSEAP